MPAPRPASPSRPDCAASFTRERQLLRAYRALYTATFAHLYPQLVQRAAYVRALGGNLAPTQVRHAEERLREVMPELIMKLTGPQQEEVAGLLLNAEADLTAVVACLVRLERNINYRDDDPRLRVGDEGLLKAAGLGRLSRAAYSSAPKLGPPLVLTAWVPVVVTRRVGAMRASHRRAARAGAQCPGQLALWPPVSGASGVRVGL